MKAGASKRTIRIAVVESDPLRFIGLKSLFDTETDLELVSCSLAELGPRKDIDLVLLGTRAGQNLFDVMAGLKAARPDLRIIVTGSGADDETILKALAAGATRALNLYRARDVFPWTHLPRWPGHVH